MELVKYLVSEQQCDVNLQNEKGDSPLLKACGSGDIATVKYLVEECNCDISLKNHSGNSALHMACRSYGGSVELVKYLVSEQQCDVNLQNEKGDSPLLKACGSGDIATVKYLVEECNCDISLKNHSGNSALHMACDQRQSFRNGESVELVKYLVSEHNCDVNLQNEKGDSPLLIACETGDIATVKYLVEECNCDISLKNHSGNSALHMACGSFRGSVELVKYLVSEQQCDVNLQNEKGDSPLLKACQRGDIATVKYLVEECNCDISLKNHSGNSALHMACGSYGGSVELVKYLLRELHCDVNLQNEKGDSPLLKACGSGDIATVKYLVEECNCDISLKNHSGNSALHMACGSYGGSVELVKYLVCERHCDVNANNQKCESPLFRACHYGNLNIVKYLVNEQHCDRSTTDDSGNSPLHVVCQGGRDYNHNVTVLVNNCNLQLNLPCMHENDSIYNKCGALWYGVGACGGNLSLCAICQQRSVCIVRFLVKDLSCLVRLQDGSCISKDVLSFYDNRSLGIVKFLTSDCGYNVDVRNHNGDTPLHVACASGIPKIVEFLVIEQHSHGNTQNKDGDSPLHVACQYGHLDIVKFLANVQHCDLSLRNKCGDSPLLKACQLQVMKYLAECQLGTENGGSCLIAMCQQRSLDIVRYLIEERSCNAHVQNKNGNSALHIACQEGNLDTVKYLSSNYPFLLSVQNEKGNLPFHCACYHRTMSVVNFLLEHRCDTALPNNDGQTPQSIPLNENGDLLLHVACQWGDVDIVKYLTKEQCCDLNVQNTVGYTPLHTAITEAHVSVTHCLLQEKQCELTLPDANGNSPLHLACLTVEQYPEMFQVARSLLSHSSVDPSCVNNAGQTPVELTTNYTLIQQINHFSECKTKHSVQTYVKIFFIGNPSTGKSTLVKAICREAGWWWKYVPKWFRRVGRVPCRTAGIIPITFRSKTFGNTVLYDMAGQVEYYSSHAAVIENTLQSSPPAFLVVVNLSESKDEIQTKLRYWWSFIDNHAARSTAPPHVILIGSHADVARSRGERVQEKMSSISAALRQLSFSCHFAGEVALDCRDPASRELDQLCHAVNQTCISLRKLADVDLHCHALYAFLLDRFPSEVACTLPEIATSIKKADALLPPTTENLLPLLSTLSDRGLILIIWNRTRLEDTWVILNKDAILSEVNGTLFAPTYFTQYKQLATSTGVVSLSRIAHLFPKYDAEMIIQFLIHLDFCFKIEDRETLLKLAEQVASHVASVTSVQQSEPESHQNSEQTETSSHTHDALNVQSNQEVTTQDPLDEYYFFPALVSIVNPHQVWVENEIMHNCAWYCECDNPNQFLSTRFLHVMILRLAFFFALAPGQRRPQQDAPVLHRRCSVWKHGIGWWSDNIETVVEVGLQGQWIVVMMRCSHGAEVNCAQYRSSVIQTIVSTKAKLCPNVNMMQFFLHPSQIKYPFKPSGDLSVYSLTDISNAFAKKHEHVIDQHCHCNPVAIEELLFFEPYFNVGPELLNELFSKDNASNVVAEDFLAHLASTLYPQMALYEKAINPQALAYQREIHNEETEAGKCLILFRKLHQRIQGQRTYENFHKELDKFSIFCGKNPMVSHLE